MPTAESPPRAYNLVLTPAEAALLHHYSVLGAATYGGKIDTGLLAVTVIHKVRATADGEAAACSLFRKMKAFLLSMPDDDLRRWL